MERLERIILAHGGGGALMRELIRDTIAAPLENIALRELADSAVLEWPGGRLAFTTDSYVVQPLFFRGGDIGRLAVAGTVNDLAVVGARPLALSLALILEEGFPIPDLRRIVESVRATAEEAHVQVVTGDTKVVGPGAADGCFITTSGVGVVPNGLRLGVGEVRPGDVVLVSGPLAQHGVAILSEREGLAFETPVESDVAPLADLAAAALAAGEIHFLRDATRGGLAAVLNELAEGAGLTVEIDERAVPVDPAVAGACDLLGLDPLTVANEGKVVAVVAVPAAEAVLAAVCSHPRGKGAAVIGRVTRDRRPRVLLHTPYGGTRLLEMPYGEDLPRIC